jgi:FMN-dependent NADH-azoreductase
VTPTKFLHIDSSISGEESASRQLSAAVVAEFARALRGLEVIHRDLDADPIPHLDSRRLFTVRPANARQGASGVPDPEGRARAMSSSPPISSSSVYNFAVPSRLTAWIDRILIPGKTFRYSDTGPIGLAGGKRVSIASSRERYLRAGDALRGE